MKTTIKEISKTFTVRLSGKADPLSRDSGYATFEFTTALTADVSLEGGSLEAAAHKLYDAARSASMRDLESAVEEDPICAAIHGGVVEDLRRRKVRDENRIKQQEER